MLPAVRQSVGAHLATSARFGSIGFQGIRLDAKPRSQRPRTVLVAFTPATFSLFSAKPSRANSDLTTHQCSETVALLFESVVACRFPLGFRYNSARTCAATAAARPSRL